MTIFDDHEIESRREILIHNYLHIFAISFLYYDHLITAGQEIEYLWMGPKIRSTYWFFLNRYIAFFGNIAVVTLGFMDLSSKSCSRFSLFRQTLLIVNQVLVCILLTLRIFALYARSLKVLAYLIASGSILLAVTCWVMFGQKSAPSETASGCHVGFSAKTAVRLAAAWEALFVYDSIIFGLIIVTTWKARQDHAVTRIRIPLISLILRDGAIYFAVMALCNLANIMTYYLCGPFLRGGLSTFASSVSVTMMSRLMLNLHETADAGIYSTGLTTTRRNHLEQYTDDTLDIVPPSAVSDADTILESTRHTP